MSGMMADGGRTVAPGQDTDAGKATVEHSPLPWRLHNPYRDDPGRAVDAEGHFVFGDSCGPSKRDAEFIIAAVNERAMLRGLVREMIDKLDDAWDFINRIDTRAEEVCDGLHEEMEKARKALGEEVGRGCAGAATKTVYRVESEDGKLGLWRDADGTWNPKFHLLRDGKCKDMPMEDSEVYREGGKRWFASAPSRELLKEWFSLEDLCDLQKHGFGIYEFEVSQWKLVSEFECIFPRDAVVGRKEIGISEIYEEAEDGNS